MADTLEGDYAEELGEDEASFGYSAALDIGGNFVSRVCSGFK